MRIVEDSISIQELKSLAQELFGDMVKAVVDTDKAIIAINAELHSDLEALLLQKGSKQAHLWGINLYPDLPESDFVEFDSMINLRPSQGNRSREVEDPKIQERILSIVNQIIKR